MAVLPSHGELSATTVGPRCPGCHKKLAESLEGRATIMCPRCKKTHTFDSSVRVHPGWLADRASREPVTELPAI